MANNVLQSLTHQMPPIGCYEMKWNINIAQSKLHFSPVYIRWNLIEHVWFVVGFFCYWQWKEMCMAFFIVVNNAYYATVQILCSLPHACDACTLFIVCIKYLMGLLVCSSIAVAVAVVNVCYSFSSLFVILACVYNRIASHLRYCRYCSHYWNVWCVNIDHYLRHESIAPRSKL